MSWHRFMTVRFANPTKSGIRMLSDGTWSVIVPLFWLSATSGTIGVALGRKSSEWAAARVGIRFRHRKGVIRRHIQLKECLLCDLLEDRGGNFSAIDSSFGFINLNQNRDSGSGRGAKPMNEARYFVLE